MIHVLVPGRAWHHRVVTSWSQSQSWLTSEQISWRLSTAYTPDIYALRNNMADAALRAGASLLIWIDSDIIWTREQFATLVRRSYSHSVVAGYYRDRDGLIAAGNWDDAYSRIDCVDGDDIRPVDWVGHGFVAIQADVYRQMQYPWYQYQHCEGKLVGEDIGFCRRLYDADITIQMDPSLRVLHAKEYYV